MQMSDISSAVEKVWETFSPTASIRSTSSSASTVEAPNEYRNLLISLSDDKADHMLWLMCLKSYTWKGNGEFDIALDKCGVPSLKNGDYSMNLAHDCLDAVLARNKSDAGSIPKLYWEGNYYSASVEDSAELTMESIAVVANKFANVLKSHGTTKGSSVLLYAPNVVQLPVVLFACARIGATLTFVNAAINNDVSDLTSIIEEAQPMLVITVDGFFMGEELRPAKKLIDEALVKSEEQLMQTFNRVIVIGHTAGNPEIPPPATALPRRPSYSLEVPFDEGRDIKWSDLILNASDNCDPCWLGTEDLLFNSIRKGMEGKWHFESYSVGQIALLVKLLSRGFKGAGLVWPFVDADDLLFLSCIFAVPLVNASLLLCETPPTHPEPSRIVEVIAKYKVEILLVSSDYAKLLIRSVEFAHLWTSGDDPQSNTAGLKKVYVTSNTRGRNEQVESLKSIFPSAEIITLFI